MLETNNGSYLVRRLETTLLDRWCMISFTGVIRISQYHSCIKVIIKTVNCLVTFNYHSCLPHPFWDWKILISQRNARKPTVSLIMGNPINCCAMRPLKIVRKTQILSEAMQAWIVSAIFNFIQSEYGSASTTHFHSEENLVGILLHGMR